MKEEEEPKNAEAIIKDIRRSVTSPEFQTGFELTK
jgi:hypothetical protein